MSENLPPSDLELVDGKVYVWGIILGFLETRARVKELGDAHFSLSSSTLVRRNLRDRLVKDLLGSTCDAVRFVALSGRATKRYAQLDDNVKSRSGQPSKWCS